MSCAPSVLLPRNNARDVPLNATLKRAHGSRPIYLRKLPAAAVTRPNRAKWAGDRGLGRLTVSVRRASLGERLLVWLSKQLLEPVRDRDRVIVQDGDQLAS